MGLLVHFIKTWYLGFALLDEVLFISNVTGHILFFHAIHDYLCIVDTYFKISYQMARVSVDILGISKLKWTGMGEFNSDDHYIYYCGQDPSEEMEWPSWSTKESEMQYLDAISKTTE